MRAMRSRGEIFDRVRKVVWFGVRGFGRLVSHAAEFQMKAGLVVCRLAGRVGGRGSGVIPRMRVCDKWDGYVCFLFGIACASYGNKWIIFG